MRRLSAANAHDLFFAQGFVVAQDRLFQIDLWRRQGAGEMAEAAAQLLSPILAGALLARSPR